MSAALKLAGFVLTAIEMLVQECDELRFSTPPLNELRHIMYHVERIRPHVALGPARSLARPRPARVARLHKARRVVEDRERRAEGPFAELGRPGVLGDCSCENGGGVVVVCGAVSWCC